MIILVMMRGVVGRGRGTRRNRREIYAGDINVTAIGNMDFAMGKSAMAPKIQVISMTESGENLAEIASAYVFPYPSASEVMQQ